MARKYLNCREHPGERSCTLQISGEEDEVMDAAVQHAVSLHGEQDTPVFRSELRHLMHTLPEEQARP